MNESADRAARRADAGLYQGMLYNNIPFLTTFRGPPLLQLLYHSTRGALAAHKFFQCPLSPQELV